MDLHGYPRKNDMDMDMDMDGIFLIHGKPVISLQLIEFCKLMVLYRDITHQTFSKRRTVTIPGCPSYYSSDLQKTTDFSAKQRTRSILHRLLD